ncbi:MAG: glutamate 5-kinase [Verrucomicrobiota bacterium]
MHRQGLRSAKRIVVKIGTRVLVRKNGRPDIGRIESLVAQICEAHKAPCEVVMVSSGAIGAGIEAMRMTGRPTSLPELQMAAAVGQSRLMTRYDQCFKAHDTSIGQVLLTRDDLRHRTRHLNARNTMLTLLRNRIVPIVNENDVIAVDEIKLGDNDILAALVTLLIGADALILLSSVDGLREPLASGRTRRVPHLERVDDDALAMISEKTDELSTGGMATKLEAARMVAHTGAAAVIADGRKNGILNQILGGKDVGTLIGSSNLTDERALRSRKKWIAYFHRKEGELHIDEGAKEALVLKGKSLLPIGIKQVTGDFGVGAMVDIKSNHKSVARGLVDYSSRQIRKIKGQRTSEIARILGSRDYDEVIHRDNMVIIHEPSR